MTPHTVEQACFANIPAHELAEVLDIVLCDMSWDHPAELWLDELKARPDAATEPVGRHYRDRGLPGYGWSNSQLNSGSA
ncbi:hypothetical protein [Candidatus Burkholderia verschuerenii]|uniref:hypothetical protein n=1 Tax=Candidatus Burkholderia verschuerenii TaxID=242163 RepID=UPI000B19FC0D|nr:hypothetical protein [Candidatus Burkholderia verschuerenii]